MVLLVPSTLVGFLPMLTFLIPVEMGEKISLGVTVLLAQIVELLVLSEILSPSSAEGFPIFGRFMILMISLIVVSIAEAIIVNAIHNFNPETEVPNFIVKLVNSRFAKLLRVRSIGKRSEQNDKRLIKKESEVADCLPEESGNYEGELKEQKDSDFPNAAGPEVHKDISSPPTDQENPTRSNPWHSVSAMIDKVFVILYMILFTGDLLFLYTQLIL